jgi:protein ImuA
MLGSKKDILAQLQRDILPLQGYRPPVAGTGAGIGLGPVERAFPMGVFPSGAVHEFLSAGAEERAATGGFVAGLLGGLMSKGGVCVWISAARRVFPAGLKGFGIDPERVIFVDLKNEKQVLWAMEEALTCEGLGAVVGEVREIGLIASRRLQLAVERSRVTGLLLRHDARSLNAIACVARWKISPLPSELEANMPGIGYPRWRVELARVRGGRPGVWMMEWSAGRFRPIVPGIPALKEVERRKTG